ncbi:MAG: hypothetical protein U0903_00130 [Planctomycetales bacterium]
MITQVPQAPAIPFVENSGVTPRTGFSFTRTQISSSRNVSCADLAMMDCELSEDDAIFLEKTLSEKSARPRYALTGHGFVEE